MSIRTFDLNIKQTLENWEVYHAIREIIANAIDEQIITDTKKIEIYKDNNTWHIRDYGRGISYHHLTQNENDEKLENDLLIGRFGVGLKDALATFHRYGIDVRIISKFGVITLKEIAKDGFEDVITLHAKIEEAIDCEMVGTDFVIEGCTARDIDKAKNLFLEFSNKEIIEKTKFGEIIKKGSDNAKIYINGIMVAEESNFLFSYNITSLTKQIKKALNRERTNVGRSAYSDRIKSILTSCEKQETIDAFFSDYLNKTKGLNHDELNWAEVEFYLLKRINQNRKNIGFVTTKELEFSPNVIDDMKSEGITPIVISESISSRINLYNEGVDDKEKIQNTKNFLEKQANRLEVDFVDYEDLSLAEKKIYDETEPILDLIGGQPENVKEILISNSLYSDEMQRETLGLWQSKHGRILIKRKQLSDLNRYAGTLLHECAHARSGEKDVSRGFERELTSIIGALAERIILDNEEGCHQIYSTSDIYKEIEHNMQEITNILSLVIPCIGWLIHDYNNDKKIDEQYIILLCIYLDRSISAYRKLRKKFESIISKIILKEKANIELDKIVSLIKEKRDEISLSIKLFEQDLDIFFDKKIFEEEDINDFNRLWENNRRTMLILIETYTNAIKKLESFI